MKKKKNIVLNPIEQHLTNAKICHPINVAARAKALDSDITWEKICCMNCGRFAIFVGELVMSIDDSKKLALYWSSRRTVPTNSDNTTAALSTEKNESNKRPLVSYLESMTEQSRQQKKMCVDCEFKFMPYEEMVVFEAQDQDIPIRIQSLQTVCLWGGEWFEAGVLYDRDSLLLIKRECLFSNKEATETDYMVSMDSSLYIMYGSNSYDSLFVFFQVS